MQAVQNVLQRLFQKAFEYVPSGGWLCCIISDVIIRRFFIDVNKRTDEKKIEK